MKVDKDHAGSGTLAVDFYRESKGKEAALVLSTGNAARCVVGDHTGSELCVETIVRFGGVSPAKNCGSDSTLHDSINRAVNNLRNGIGVNKVASDHAGGNTCAAVIAAAV